MQSIASKRGRGRRNFRGRGGINNSSKRLDMKQINFGFLWTPSKEDITRSKKTKIRAKKLVKPLILLIVLLHIVILELMK